jgi:hypothetical protein
MSPGKESPLAVERIGSAGSAVCASAFVICGPAPAAVMIARAKVADRYDVCELLLLDVVFIFMFLVPVKWSGFSQHQFSLGPSAQAVATLWRFGEEGPGEKR